MVITELKSFVTNATLISILVSYFPVEIRDNWTNKTKYEEMLNDSNNLISLTGHSLLNDLFNKNGGKNSMMYRDFINIFCQNSAIFGKLNSLVVFSCKMQQTKLFEKSSDHLYLLNLVHLLQR